MGKYEIVAENPESTVLAEYQPVYKKETEYQSETELESELIEILKSQAYEYLPIHDEKELVSNLKHRLEKLNDYTFADSEWEQFFKTALANENNGITEKTAMIQEAPVQLLKREDGSFKNIKLIDKDDIHNNFLQVINQYATDAGARDNRYDVTVLVNGLPMVHIELKKRGIDLREAFNQIERYQRESFWSGCGLFEYVQLFVISNGTYTKYYSNTTRFYHIEELKRKNVQGGKRTSYSFEFTSWWADAANRQITDLTDFAKTFFSKHTLLSILTRYCVFTSEKMLLVMRPYQIAATERILERIKISNNYKTYGTVKGGGYIWHTTGSGKTLTSFKTAQLASRLPYIDKVLFVVDRKDLDYQTMREYDKFQKGAANSNTNTTVLKKQMEKADDRIIITTIQKLSVFIKKYSAHEALKKHFVIIFDECHRSQFGDMHLAITRHFKKYHLFGFTGTPIMSVNASAGKNPTLRTTDQVFGDRLHTYTIVDAITDKNVLPFKVDYISTMKEEEKVSDEQVWDINREKALAAPERIRNIVRYIIEHFNAKTYRNDKFYSFNTVTNISELVGAADRNKVEEMKQKVRLSGFNSIFAVSSIQVLRLYYTEFRKQMAELPEVRRLKVATIFSFGVNEDVENGTEDENPEDTGGLDKSSRDFLDSAIQDYNAMFKTNYDTSSEKFQNYYKDVSLRMKNREIDILLVVNMFLTGFDATTLNTLWVDKNLRMHGLLQAFSRTNRILNSIKTFGNIVCFRNLEEATNKSISIFGDREAKGIVLLKTFDEYYNGYKDGDKEVKGYRELVQDLLDNFPLGSPIVGENARKEFIRLYGQILRLRNILFSFDSFDGKWILAERDLQDYSSIYINLYNEIRPPKKDCVNINDDVVFEMELIKQVEINIDYILMLVRKYHDSNCTDKEIVSDIHRAIDSTVELRDKKDLIDRFIASLTPSSEVDEDWRKFVDAEKISELEKIISDEHLDREKTYRYIRDSFSDGSIQSSGTALAAVLPPMSRFDGTSARSAKRTAVIEKLTAFFNRFWDICGGIWKNQVP